MDVHSWMHQLRNYSIKDLRANHESTCSHIALSRLKNTLHPAMGETLDNARIALETLIAKKQGESK